MLEHICLNLERLAERLYVVTGGFVAIKALAPGADLLLC